MKDENIVNMAYFMGRLLKPFVAIWAPVYALQKVRCEIADPQKMDEPLELGKRIRKHTKSFMECKVHALPDFFVHKAVARNERRKQEYDNSYTMPINVQPEIKEKQIGDIVAKLENTPIITVSYFERTEHQPWAPSLCDFGDYVIQFSSAGTEWCGGMRGNGYISKKMPDGTRKPICTISPDLSDYLAEIADRQYELMKMKNR
ncbi:MAG: hypothetical protein II179_00650 [Alphaproteobacteria bacterium]|nr:hypothetical protein [Alphaproteobacteria bacterium]